MIVDIEIENVKSFKDNTVFSMEVDDETEIGNSSEIKLNSNKTINILKTAALFGANASGKSNFITSLKIFRYFLLVQGKNKFREESFRFESENKNSILKMKNIIDGKIYEYFLELNFKEQKIIKEELSIEDNIRNSIFIRQNNKIKEYNKNVFSNHIKTIEFLNETLNDSDSILSRIKEWKVPKEIQKYINYLEDLIIDNRNYNIGKFIYTKTKSKKVVLNFLNTFGINVTDIEVHREKDEFFIERLKEYESFRKLDDEKKETILSEIEKYRYHIDFIYKDSKNKKYKLTYSEQSEGTKRLLLMFLPIYYVLNKGGVVIIDELDKTLHYNLIKKIIKMFNSIENIQNAQLIFTTHNLMLLDFNLLRKDQIWFLENNNVLKGTELYSLSDIKNYKKDKYLLRDYLNGNFGGIPKLKDFGIDVWLEKKE